jgi:GNAT superfamily N-acetyltransferase
MRFHIQPERPSRNELLGLYAVVGWTAYTGDPDQLKSAIDASYLVLAVRTDDGQLVGLARVVSDGLTIAYIQDVLVAPSFRREGIGGALLDEVLRWAVDIRQVVLLTDADPAQRAFYESRGLTEIRDAKPNPLRSFVRLT